MNELLRFMGMIALSFLLLRLAKRLIVYLEMKKLSRTPAEELYEECSGKEEWRDTEREPHKES